RREHTKRKIEEERRKRVAVAKARVEPLEEQRITGGIKILQQLRPVPTSGDGDKTTLPVSALEELNPQNALELGVFTFELLNDEP
ncbi:hypothetical protein BBJ28_00023717, partial [Nothophytophthora sp. Chile5]